MRHYARWHERTCEEDINSDLAGTLGRRIDRRWMIRPEDHCTFPCSSSACPILSYVKVSGLGDAKVSVVTPWPGSGVLRKRMDREWEESGSFKKFLVPRIEGRGG